MTMITSAQILAHHVVRGWEVINGRPVLVICKCGAVTLGDDYRGDSRHLAVEPVHARHQAEVLATFRRGFFARWRRAGK